MRTEPIYPAPPVIRTFVCVSGMADWAAGRQVAVMFNEPLHRRLQPLFKAGKDETGKPVVEDLLFNNLIIQ